MWLRLMEVDMRSRKKENIAESEEGSWRGKDEGEEKEKVVLEIQ